MSAVEKNVYLAFSNVQPKSAVNSIKSNSTVEKNKELKVYALVQNQFQSGWNTKKIHKYRPRYYKDTFSK